MELVIRIRNRNPDKLQRLRDWINDALDSWNEDKELPMKDTEWTCSIRKTKDKR